MTTHLIIPDAHCIPSISNERFTWLGKLVAEIQPDVIIDIGDWCDMESLCFYDKGKIQFEGRRYQKDVTCALDAKEKFENEIAKVSKYKPTKIAITGNHEQRIERVAEETPELKGVLSVEDLGYLKYGWKLIPYLTPYNIDGILYAHYFSTGVMGKAMSGENVGARLIKSTFQSCTMGHSHRLDIATRTRKDGTRLWGLVCGCFFEHYLKYAPTDNNAWWRGVILKRDVKKGNYNPTFISLDVIKKRYK